MSRVVCRGAAVVFVFGRGGFHVDDARGPDQVEKILDGVAASGVGALVGEGMRGECVVNVGHGAQPSDTDVSDGGAVFSANVRDVEGKVGPS